MRIYSVPHTTSRRQSMYKLAYKRDDFGLVRQEDVVRDVRNYHNLDVRLLAPYRKLPLLPTRFLGFVCGQLCRIVCNTAV